MKNFMKVAATKIRDFRSGMSGNVALIFALTLVPLVIVAGFALEYSGASSVRVKLQAATDAAVLAGSGVTPWSAESCTARALNTFNGRMADQSIKSEIPPVISCEDTGASISSEAQVPTSLLGVAGIKSIALASSSQTVCGMQSEADASSTPTAWQQTALPSTTRVVTLGTTVGRGVRYWQTDTGNPMVRLDNPQEGPSTIVIRSVPAAPDGNMSFDLPARGQFFVILPFVPAGRITLFVQDGPLPKSGGSASWNNDNTQEFSQSQIPGTPIYPGELVRRCWISQ